MQDEKCKYFDCNFPLRIGSKYCDFHFSGGDFGNGETYDQYQLIEQDFIDFLKIIPISDDAHLIIHSPVLRDIIIRSCTQIEIFLKEWGKFHCLENSESKLHEEFNKLDKISKEPKGERNWTFGSYHEIKINYFNLHRKIYVRPIGQKISPFEGWNSEKEAPFWWNTYNAIKHNGIKSRKEATLNTAMYSLAALFQLHCENQYSYRYLKDFVQFSIDTSRSGVKIKSHSVSTPIDSKRYLFKETIISDKEIELVTMKNYIIKRRD